MYFPKISVSILILPPTFFDWKLVTFMVWGIKQTEAVFLLTSTTWRSSFVWRLNNKLTDHILREKNSFESLYLSISLLGKLQIQHIVETRPRHLYPLIKTFVKSILFLGVFLTWNPIVYALVYWGYKKYQNQKDTLDKKKIFKSS